MSRLDNLIDQYCPNGVKYENLGNIVKFINGRAYKQAELLDSGKYRVLRVGNFFTSDKWYFSDLELDEEKYCKNGDLLYAWAASLGPQIWEGEKTIFHYHIWKLEFDEKVLLKRYLYHFLLKDVNDIYGSLTHSTMPHVSMANMKERKIPVPPLEVQREIVCVLDKFTFLSAELSAKLSEEFSARRKQYEYYRDQILRQNRDECKTAKLSEIAKVYDGTHQTPDYKSEGIPFISVENIGNIYSSSKFISKEAFAAYKIKPQVGDLFMTRIGAIGKCAVMTKSEALAYYVSLALIRPNQKVLDARYLKHYIESTYGSKELSKRTLHNAVPIKINKDDIGKIIIRYPSLELQIRIANILDNFDTVCSDLNIGLTTEIEARQKQYEYYRDLLLTFVEIGRQA